MSALPAEKSVIGPAGQPRTAGRREQRPGLIPAPGVTFADLGVPAPVVAALAEDGISRGFPVEVDADHGTVTLSGVVASAADVKAAAEDAAGVHGVMAVRNQLRPH